jgi:hypothetical protein
MSKTSVGVISAASLIVAGLAMLIPLNDVRHYDYTLVDMALIIDPIVNQEWNDAATNLYLEPNGFEGTATTLNMPEVIPGDNLQQAVGVGVQDLVKAVEDQYNAGGVDAADPLYVFGYSQSSVVASLAEQQLHDYGIPTDDLHFVLVGDSASAEGGILNTLIESLPTWLQPLATEILEPQLGDVLGATTPDNLFPTDVYTLSGDGWANWDDGANILGMLSTHLEYLGMTSAEVNTATLSVVDGLTDYFTINSANIDGLAALWNGLIIAASALQL